MPLFKELSRKYLKIIKENQNLLPKYVFISKIKNILKIYSKILETQFLIIQ